MPELFLADILSFKVVTGLKIQGSGQQKGRCGYNLADYLEQLCFVWWSNWREAWSDLGRSLWCSPSSPRPGWRWTASRLVTILALSVSQRLSTNWILASASSTWRTTPWGSATMAWNTTSRKLRKWFTTCQSEDSIRRRQAAWLERNEGCSFNSISNYLRWLPS